MKSWQLSAFVLALVAGCSAAPTATPDVSSTPNPTVNRAAPTFTIEPTVDPSPVATRAPTPTVQRTPAPSTARPTATATPSRTPQPTTTAYQDEISLPGTIGLTRVQFTRRWNDRTPDETLRIQAAGWQTQSTPQGELAQYIFRDPELPAYQQVAVGVLLNDDASIRSASVVYVPGGDPRDHQFERLIAIFAHQTLVDTVLPDGPQHVSQRDAVTARLSPPLGEDYSGMDVGSTVAGVRFRLVDNRGEVILFIAREDNLGE